MPIIETKWVINTESNFVKDIGKELRGKIKLKKSTKKTTTKKAKAAA